MIPNTILKYISAYYSYISGILSGAIMLPFCMGRKIGSVYGRTEGSSYSISWNFWIEQCNWIKPRSSPTIHAEAVCPTSYTGSVVTVGTTEHQAEVTTLIDKEANSSLQVGGSSFLSLGVL